MTDSKRKMYHWSCWCVSLGYVIIM